MQWNLVKNNIITLVENKFENNNNFEEMEI